MTRRITLYKYTRFYFFFFPPRRRHGSAIQRPKRQAAAQRGALIGRQTTPASNTSKEANARGINRFDQYPADGAALKKEGGPIRRQMALLANDRLHDEPPEVERRQMACQRPMSTSKTDRQMAAAPNPNATMLSQ